MVEPSVPSPLESFKINTWYKYLLYVFGIILILSFFVEAKSVDVVALRQFSFNTVALGMFLWIFDNLYEGISSYLDEEAKHHNKSHESIMNEALGISVFGYIVIIISIVVWWISVAGLKLTP